ncbi:Oidioi.mRNA.OKI2018_I69.chr2.g8064.t1.cds [Oikopleura dioica]|uniref:Oidioi.mRNA.OKI2018_I69.chr2.g8064.t1.cds n=1 Tax=Oikopleura dioica TaxID=34765 RepID=A0ABN7TEN2_OIKDI|nr:Oidioi.mRNA.OKI2018_I69.chr2.g8064.t1.cds [Oikopleura dioica]
MAANYSTSPSGISMIAMHLNTRGTRLFRKLISPVRSYGAMKMQLLLQLLEKQFRRFSRDRFIAIKTEWVISLCWKIQISGQNLFSS